MYCTHNFELMSLLLLIRFEYSAKILENVFFRNAVSFCGTIDFGWLQFFS